MPTDERYRHADVPHGLVHEPDESPGAAILAAALALCGIGATVLMAVIAIASAVMR